VTSATIGGNTNSYDYDSNGNQTHRLVHTIVNGQPVTQEFEMGYDAENRVVSVTGINGTNYSANFVYDGNGQRVKSTINGETILFVGGYFELKGSEIIKYYPGGAMRKYVIPQSMNVEYVLSDHLGSASIMTDSNGSKVSEMRYTPWGEVRYSWVDPNLSTTPAYTLPKRTFTGQYSYMDDPSTQGVDGFGLMFYNARFYDPQVGRFAQADTIVPGGVHGLDRYAYVNNNPVRYTDPSGHTIQGRCNWMKNYDCEIYGPTAAKLAAEAAYNNRRCYRNAMCFKSGIPVISPPPPTPFVVLPPDRRCLHNPGCFEYQSPEPSTVVRNYLKTL
jgi:RHS repeat-associated protein